jgi:anthranilate synthase component 1
MQAGVVRPSRESFRDLAREYTVVPVWREVLADFETPLSAYVKLVGRNEGFLLESVEHAERWGRFSFLGRNPARTFLTRGRTVEWLDGDPPDGVPTDRGTLAALEALGDRFRAPKLPELPPFHGGIVGWLGYDTVREIERLPNVPHDDTGFPDAVCSLAGQVAAFDHFGQRLYLIENVYPVPGASAAALDVMYDAAVARLESAVDELGRPLPYQPAVPPAEDLGELPDVTRNFSPEVWAAAVEAAKEHILEGDIFQVVLAQRFDLVEAVDPFDVYRVLRLVNPSPYMYFLHHPEATVVGSSPEALVQVRDKRVVSRPIAGTRRRGRNEEHDRRMEAELVEHPKERAEHVMLVDLARNDLGRVVRYGTEHVEELMTLERYSHVMHMTSQVAGELAAGKNPVDVLRATFPAGTVSGAPKVRAMEIIDELEPTKRGPYAGVVGYVDFSGNLDTAIAIRTMFWREGRATLQAGAGIVADSVPADEDLECRNKARALLTAAAAARRLFQDPA